MFCSLSCGEKTLFLFDDFIMQIFKGLSGRELNASEPQPSKLTCCIFSLNGNCVGIGLESGEVKVRLVAMTCR